MYDFYGIYFKDIDGENLDLLIFLHAKLLYIFYHPYVKLSSLPPLGISWTEIDMLVNIALSPRRKISLAGSKVHRACYPDPIPRNNFEVHNLTCGDLQLSQTLPTD